MSRCAQGADVGQLSARQLPMIKVHLTLSRTDYLIRKGHAAPSGVHASLRPTKLRCGYHELHTSNAPNVHEGIGAILNKTRNTHISLRLIRCQSLFKLWLREHRRHRPNRRRRLKLQPKHSYRRIVSCPAVSFPYSVSSMRNFL